MYCNFTNIKFLFFSDSGDSDLDIYKYLCYNIYFKSYIKVYGNVLWNFNSSPSKNIYIKAEYFKL